MLSQHAALSLNADSWSSRGFGFHDVPSPRTLQSIDGKVNAFIHCFIDVQKMTTVHNLGVEICRNEGVEQFEEFGVGPLLQHLLMQHYFSVPADAKEVCKIAIEDMITHLSVLLCRAKNREITIDEFLDFLVKKYEVEKEEDLGGVRCRAWAYDQVISGIDWSTMSNKIVTVSYDRNLYVWNHGASEWVPTLIILRLNRAALCVQWSPKENKFVVGSGAKTVCICLL